MIRHRTKVLELKGFSAQLHCGFGTRDWVSEAVTMATLRQIHSDRVLLVDRPGIAGEGDAMISATPDLTLAIRTADCYPILLADLKIRAVAAIHAGWRGTAARIVQKTVEKMRAEFGSRPEKLIAAIGPGIGVCCYEVGEEVARLFGLSTRGKIDLARANREQLLESGVPAAQIHSIARCTFCEPEVFHSYRRDGDRAGRMISFIAAARK
jgi:polyphenol oxidase